jgi:hypothetical protein
MGEIWPADLAIWTKAIRSPGDAVIIDDLAERAWVGRIVQAVWAPAR